MARLRMVVEVNDNVPTIVEVAGGDAWALEQLMSWGPTGCTSLRPGLPWSHYVWKLRRAGISIETRDQPHAILGPRYILRSAVRVVSIDPSPEEAECALARAPLAIVEQFHRALDALIAIYTPADEGG